jgi:hypothetical protein
MTRKIDMTNLRRAALLLILATACSAQFGSMGQYPCLTCQYGNQSCYSCHDSSWSIGDFLQAGPWVSVCLNCTDGGLIMNVSRSKPIRPIDPASTITTEGIRRVASIQSTLARKIMDLLMPSNPHDDIAAFGKSLEHRAIMLEAVKSSTCQKMKGVTK